LTRQAEPGNAAMKSGAEPRNPFYHQRISMITTPTPHTNVKNGPPPLDNTRPFMDDTGRLLSLHRSACDRPEARRCRQHGQTRVAGLSRLVGRGSRAARKGGVRIDDKKQLFFIRPVMEAFADERPSLMPSAI
jgi:hypothetical protein